MCRRRLGVLLVGMTVAMFLAAGPAATKVGAQEALIEADPLVVKARADLQATQAAAHVAAADLERTTEQRDAVQADIVKHQTEIGDLEQQRTDLATQVDGLLQNVRARAAALYVAGGDGTTFLDMLTGPVLEAARRKELGDAAARNDRATMRQLKETRRQLGLVQDHLRNEQTNLESQHASLNDLLGRLEQQRVILDQRVAAANAALKRAREIGALHAAGEPIMGPATLSAAQMMAWYNAQGYRPRLSAGVTVTQLAQMFIQEGSDEGVRGDFAFAQAIIESGGFSAAPANNYSGLGWCDSCSRGTSFPTPRDGIRAQIQLLLNYANPYSRASQLHHPPSPYWWDSDPVKAARYFDTYFAKGWAPTWSDMGHGNWATDPKYAGKVIGVYRRMVAFTQGVPAA